MGSASPPDARPGSQASTEMVQANTARNRRPALAVLAAALILLSAGTADASCSARNRVDYRNAECLSAWWKNRGLFRKSPYYVRNMCPEYGKVVAKVDLKSAGDRTLHLADGLPREGDTRHRIRGISCCSDTGALCNRSDLVTDTGCLARFRRTSSAAWSCMNETAAAAISGNDYNCTVRARCKTGTFRFGRPVYANASITVPWPDLDDVHNCGGVLKVGSCSRSRSAAPALSVGDAHAGEGRDASLDFTVTLSRPHPEPVMVRYATSDGTATAGSDYIRTSGILTFAANETSKTIRVPVLDDDHDEGPETLTFVLSAPAPSHVRLADAEATGAIANTDGIPGAWLGRFGRTVADHALDAMAARIRMDLAPGTEVSLAGERIALGPLSGSGADPGHGATEEVEAEAGSASTHGAVVRREPGRSTAWLTDDDAPWQAGLRASRPMTARELLPRASFSMTARTDGMGFVSVWGGGAATRFSGRDGDLSTDGEVTSVMLGVDWTQDTRSGARPGHDPSSGAGIWTMGLVVSHSRGNGGYRGAGAGKTASTLTAAWPWVRQTLSERLSVWGVAGYGAGSLTIEPERAPAIRTGMDLRMAAAGLRGLVADGGEDGLTLLATTDATIVQTSSEAVSGRGGNLAAATADVTRLRLGFEGSRPFRLADGSVLTPRAGVAVRRDGGDVETGFGADIDAGIAWADPKRGLGAELHGRMLLTHRAAFRRRAVSGSFSWDPAGGGRGPRFSVIQTLSVPAQARTDSAPGRTMPEPLAANDAGLPSWPSGYMAHRQRLTMRYGYGFPAFGDRFSSTPGIGVGLSSAGRDYSLGWRLVRAGAAPDGSFLEVAVDVRRRETNGDRDVPQEHLVGLRVTSHF